MGSENHTSIKYSCRTQDGLKPTIGPTIAARLPEGKGRPDKLVLGIGRIVPRWDVSDGNTKLQYYVKTETFPTATVAKLAGEKLQEAADEWNALSLGIIISQAPDKRSAHFDLVYSTNDSDNEGTLAQAFFPNEVEQDVIVFEYGLSRENKGILKNVFEHELGHVLGLRHEFAIKEEGEGAVLFGARNPNSVMAYVFPPTIQQTDKDGIQAFYKKKNGDVIGRFRSPITDFIPTPRKIV
jgi:hypothetical protein